MVTFHNVLTRRKLVVAQWNTGAELKKRQMYQEEREAWEENHSKKPLKIGAGKVAKQKKKGEEKNNKRKASNPDGRPKKYRKSSPAYVKPGSGKLLLHVSLHEPTTLILFYHS